MASYKARHEAFVSNLQGGPLAEVFAVSAVSALWFVFAAAMKQFLQRDHVAIDFVFAVLPNVLLVTVWSDRVFEIFLLLVVFLPFLRLLRSAPRSVMDARDHPACVSCFRGLMLCCTSVCILGVDFPAFPRRFAKAESFGTGLMDIGVGSFALALGLVSREARGLQSRVRATLRGTVAPLLLLGALRTLSVKATGYQEHVTEYGVHWNFFLTLGCSKILVMTLHAVFSGRAPLLAMAFAASALQETQLRMGGAQFALEAERSNFLAANKEGFVSLFAFAALELWGTWIGRELHHRLRRETRGRFPVPSLLLLLFTVASAGVTLQVLSGPTSRRLGNLSYMAWVVSNASTTLFIFLFGQMLLKERTGAASPSLLGSSDVLGLLNRSGLFYFLIANLATGMVNVCFDTLAMHDGVAVGILCAYQLLLLGSVRAYDAFHRRP